MGKPSCEYLSAAETAAVSAARPSPAHVTALKQLDLLWSYWELSGDNLEIESQSLGAAEPAAVAAMNLPRIVSCFVPVALLAHAAGEAPREDPCTPYDGIQHPSQKSVCCCLACAKQLQRGNKLCPICREPIEAVLRLFTS